MVSQRVAPSATIASRCESGTLRITSREIETIVGKIRGYGIENIMALRGDPPKDGRSLSENIRDYRYAADLVRHLRKMDHFCIGVAGYPEKHPEAATMEEDLRSLKEKVDAGADFITTQLFFDNADYYRFIERVRGQGITLPVVPGLMPVTNYGQIQKFAAMCGARIPPEILRALEPRQNDPEYVIQYGIDWTYRQARDLIDKGAPGIHFYTLNKSRSTEVILSRLLEQL